VAGGGVFLPFLDFFLVLKYGDGHHLKRKLHPMVLAAASCWVPPVFPTSTQSARQAKKYFPRQGCLNWKGFVNDFKSDEAHLTVFVKRKVSLKMNVLANHCKYIIKSIFPAAKKTAVKNQFFSGRTRKIFKSQCLARQFLWFF
jgi:hypothetical protein